jgi:hypothetical protein
MAAAVRGSSVVGGSGVTSLATGSFTSATGDTIGVWFNYGASTDPTSVTDNKGNTYTQRGKVSRTGSFTSFLYTCENATGGAGTVVTLNIGFTEYPTLAAVAMSGVVTSSVLDVLTTDGVDTVQPWTLSSGTLAQADEIVFGFVGSDSGGASDTFTEGSGMTKLGEVVDSNLYWTGALAYVVVAATTARVQSWTNSGGGSNSTQIVASFKASGGGGGPTTTTATAAAGVATVSGVGASSAKTTGTAAAGTATVAGVGSSTAVTTATAAAGSATVSAVGAAVILTTATAAAGAATVSGVGSSTAATGGQANGVATVSGAGASTAATAGQAAGSATVSAVGSSSAATTATPAAGSATVSAVGSSVAAGQTTAVPAEGVATVSAQGSSIVATTAVPAQGSSEVSATTPTSGGGGYDDARRKVRKRVNELNKKILQAEQETKQTAVTKAKSVQKSAPTEQGFDEDEEEALMLLL